VRHLTSPIWVNYTVVSMELAGLEPATSWVRFGPEKGPTCAVVFRLALPSGIAAGGSAAVHRRMPMLLDPCLTPPAEPQGLGGPSASHAATSRFQPSSASTSRPCDSSGGQLCPVTTSAFALSAGSTRRQSLLRVRYACATPSGSRNVVLARARRRRTDGGATPPRQVRRGGPGRGQPEPPFARDVRRVGARVARRPEGAARRW